MTDQTWQPIETAKKKGERGRYGDWTPAPHIDILAKFWDIDTDKFVFGRFTNCYWDNGDDMTNRKGSWRGVDQGWRPVAWMPIPPIPESYP